MFLDVWGQILDEHTHQRSQCQQLGGNALQQHHLKALHQENQEDYSGCLWSECSVDQISSQSVPSDSDGGNDDFHAEECTHVTGPVLHYKWENSKTLRCFLLLRFWSTEERKRILLNRLING